MEQQDIWIAALAAVLAVSEAMSLIPYFKDNGILQFIIRISKKLLPKKDEMKVEMKKEDDAT